MGWHIDYHTKWSKSYRERQYHYITYMWNLVFFLKKINKLTYLYNKNRLTDIEKQTYGYQKRNIVGRINEKLGMNTHTLLYIRLANQQGHTI